MMNRLTPLINQRLEFFSKTAQVTAENITNAELKGAYRKDIKSFLEIYRNAPQARTRGGQMIKDVRDVTLQPKHISVSKNEISREMESLKMTRIAREHDHLVRLMRTFQDMVKNILDHHP